MCPRQFCEEVKKGLLARALRIAARNGWLRKVHKIVELQGDWGEWLRYAACSGDPEEAEVALENRADVNARSPKGCTPLIAAAINGHAEVVRLLLAWGADPTLETDSGLTARGAANHGFEFGAFPDQYAQVAAALDAALIQ